MACGQRAAVRADRTHHEPLAAGGVFVAPDARHLGVTASLRVRLLDTPPISGFRPSATCLFESAAAAIGNGLIAVVLTGMGRDGVDGLESAAAAGATVLVQDETTSVVFGMGQETVQRGLAHSVLPLERIAPALVELSSNAKR